MLKEFRIKNFKSFKNEEILSLEAMNKIEKNLDNFNLIELENDRLLKSIAIYGHNSFGKSNLFKGLAKMIEILENCMDPNYTMKVDAFELDNTSKNEPTKFEINFILKGVTYKYGFLVLKDLIVKEWLYKKNKRETKIFRRYGVFDVNIIINYNQRKYEKYKEKLTTNQLFLSSLIKENISGEMKDIYDYITKNIKIIFKKNSFNETLKLIEKNEIDNKNIESIFKKLDINLNKDLKDISFNLEEEISEGTKRLYSLIGPILDCINKGYVLFIDELDLNLSYEIVKYIIELFHDLSININNAQLIFNTRNFYLLKEDLFRKDQIYFIDKDKSYISTLYSLGDFKDLEDNTNLLANYLAGNFGSIGNIE